MTDLQDFWLQLHRLSQAYGAIGSTVGEATAALVDQFQDKAPEAQREASDQILVMLTALEELHARIKS
jgi:hypothetical protein